MRWLDRMMQGRESAAARVAGQRTRDAPRPGLVWWFGAWLAGGLLLAGVAGAQTPLRLYLDADRTGARASGLAIEQGIRVALSERGDRLAGRPVELAIRDHRGSSPRSRAHLEEFLADRRALAVFSGLHSPPLLAHREFINANAILVLNPWAAAAGITRPEQGENWIFRLSIDDRRAGEVLVEHAVRRGGFQRPFLLLEETGWGRSNEQTMTRALAAHGLEPAGLLWFRWGLGDHEARILLRHASAAGSDVILLVANAPEGKALARAMLDLPAAEQLPLRSHWGITGGNFVEALGPERLARLDLAFLQTRFSFLGPEQSRPLARQVLERARRLFPREIRAPEDIRAPAGFVHAYDLTRLLIAAVDQAGLTGVALEDRRRVRHALEALDGEVEGLLKTYRRPFRPYRPDDPDAHEALGPADWTLGRYGSQGEIRLDLE